MVRRFLCLVAAIGLLGAGTAAAQIRYGWTISNSTVDPLSNRGTPTSSVTTLYLWYACSDGDGMTAAEFGIESNGITHLATTPVNGFLNAGGTTNLLLAVGGCPERPMLAANLLVVDTGGTLCFIPSTDHGVRGTVNCDQIRPALYGFDWIGYSSRGDPCRSGSLCQSDLEPQAWGTIKGRYKR